MSDINYSVLEDLSPKLKDYKIIGIEGSSFAGKSILSDLLTIKLNAKQIQEYYFYCQNKFPKFPPDSQAELIQNIDFFLDLEKRRKADLDIHQEKTVLVDRTILSISAFQYMVRLQCLGVLESLDLIFEKITAAVKRAEIIQPDALLLLSPNKNEFDRRLKKRGRVNIDFLNDYECIKNYREHIINNTSKVFNCPIIEIE